MKKNYILFMIVVGINNILLAQSTPPSGSQSNSGNSITVLNSMTDTITFDAYNTGDLISNQYLTLGAVFSGFNGNGLPEVYDYGSGSYGKILHSDTWYDMIKLSFVDPLNPTIYTPVQHIEFDNPVSSEVDYISIDVYNASNSIIYHYLSTSPEHIVINIPGGDAAYMTFDDSAVTAFVIDNILFEISPTGITEHPAKIWSAYPNPFNNTLTLSIPDLKVNDVDLELRNTLGQSVIQKHFSADQPIKIDGSELAKGIYFLEINWDGKHEMQKIVRQ